MYVANSSKLLLFLLVQAVFGFDLPFGERSAALSNPLSSPTAPNASLPHPMHAINNKVYILDAEKQKLLICHREKGLRRVVNLNREGLKPVHPVISFQVLSQYRMVILNQAGAVYLVDLLSNSCKEMISSTSVHSILPSPATIRLAGEYIWLEDPFLRTAACYSQNGNFLGSLNYTGEESYPYSVNQILVLEKLDDGFALVLHSYTEDKKVLARFEDRKILKLNLIGSDESSAFYFEKLHGEDHGVPKYSIVKLNFMGSVEWEKPVSISPDEDYQLARRFFLARPDLLLQIRLNSDGLGFRSLDFSK